MSRVPGGVVLNGDAAPAADAALAAEDVTVRFGGLTALDGVSVRTSSGRITGLIGPNGAGKTTLFNVCCGFQRAVSGTVVIDGVDVTSQLPAQRARRGLARTFQRMELFGSMTVRENVELAVEAQFIGVGPLSQLGLVRSGAGVRAAVRERADEVIEAVGLEGVLTRQAGELPTGVGRLVELARAVARGGHILLLDEPSSGLDARETRQFGELLRRLVTERSLAVLLVEHDMSLVLGTCDWINVLDFGKPIDEGTPDDIRQSEVVRAAYLGQSAATITA